MRKIYPELFFACDCTKIIKSVGLMNGIQASAEEVVLKELVYA